MFHYDFNLLKKVKSQLLLSFCSEIDLLAEFDQMKHHLTLTSTSYQNLKKETTQK